MTIYDRWKADQPREGRIIPAVGPDHWIASSDCSKCGCSLGNGQPLQFYVLGPDSEESWERHRAGRWYSAVAIMLHADCLAPPDAPPG